MNWGKGFFRLWIVGSILWATWATLDIWKNIERNRRARIDYNLPDVPFNAQDAIFLALYVFLPIVGVYIVGRIIGWIAKGFTRE
jgi:hypothetical protein